MRTHFVPWLSSQSPNLESQGHPPAETAHPQLSEEEKQALLKPKHMNESYTSFELPLASDPELLEKYVNTSGGFRECPRAVLRRWNEVALMRCRDGKATGT